jgi:hypothetical protein
MRLLFTKRGFCPIGGSESLAYQFATRLAARGHDVRVVCAWPAEKEETAYRGASFGPRVYDDFLTHARAERKLPGQGELDVVGLIRAAARNGFVGPYCVEVNTPEFRALPVDEAARQAADTANEVLAAALSVGPDEGGASNPSSAAPPTTAPTPARAPADPGSTRARPS